MNNNILTEPPAEENIVANWNPERGDLVSVCMLAYNHEPYLRDALNSVLNQKTDFGFEILIHDDASQDASPIIIREYAARYPRIVKPILQSVNQHSQRIYPSVHFNYPRANLPFVAMCEGDDYWTDENKLQLQVDGLTAHPKINFSFHTAILADYHEPGCPSRIFGDYDTKDTIVPFTDIMHRVRGMIPTASSVIRQSAKVRFLDFLKSRPYLTVGDLYFQFFGSAAEGALYFARPMSLYRYRTEHSWTRKTHLDKHFKATHEMAMLRSYIELDQLTGNIYHNEFVTLTLQRLPWLFDSKASPPSSLPGIATLESIHKSCQAEIERTLDQLGQTNARYVIYGSASGGRRILDTLPSTKIAAVIDRDNHRVGESMGGKPIIGVDSLHEYADCELIVSTIAPNRALISELAAGAGIPGKAIHYIYDGALQFLDEHPIPTDIFEG